MRAPQTDPRTEYQTRLERWREEHADESRLYEIVVRLRLATGIAAAVLAWLAFSREALHGAWLAAPVAVFLGLVVWHARIARRQELASRAIDLYERGIGRLEDRWAGAGNAGERFRDPGHVYAEDLDLFGRGSLFELLCAARTATGEQTLARWLKVQDPAEPRSDRDDRQSATREIVARQEAVEELRSRLDLREDLALLGEDVRAALHAESLSAWATAPQVPFPRAARPLAIGLAFLAASAIAASLAGLVSGRLVLYVAMAEWIVGAVLRRQVEAVLHAVDEPAHELGILAAVLARLERERFTSTRLAELRRQLEVESAHARAPEAGRPLASSLIAELETLVDRRDWSENLAFRIPAFLMMWDPRYAMRIERWRREHGAAVPRWIAAVGEIEALSSLGGYAYEHPGAPFPDLVAGSPRVEAEGMHHPLLPRARSVANDLAIGADGGDPALVIVSGSNMSGKSTLLRALGLNVVLARAGAPVAASRFRLSPVSVGASIRIIDSLQDNRSRFYAEITRLRQILDLTGGPLPVLFLVDEMLHGTNSHDRRVGAQAVLERLLARGAVGLVTTHDLALSAIADSLPRRAAGGQPAPGAANVHFEDRLENGRMVFDYALRPGAVQHGNALDLMRGLGLID